jgi:mRNA interferase HigB
MQILNRQPLEDFKREHADARKQLNSWEALVGDAKWELPQDLKNSFPKARTVGNMNAIFNICRDNYRLWVKVAYNTGVVFIKNIGTHKEYDNWEIK